MKKRSTAAAVFATIAGLLFFGAVNRPLHAQNPGDRFFPVEEGLLDLETGLVWGFPLYETAEYLRTINRSTGGGTYTWGGAQGLWLADDPDNEDHFSNYQQFSNWYANRNDNDWRCPTRDEMVEAAQAGIVDYLDRSPAGGFQSWFDENGAPASYAPAWSSTRAGKIRQFEYAYHVNLYTGGVGTATLTSILYGPVPVRGVPAPPEDDGPGNGNGNGKGKNK